MQDNEGHFGGLHRTTSTPNEGQCRKIFKKSLKIPENTGWAPVHTPIKNKSKFSYFDTLLLAMTVKVA